MSMNHRWRNLTLADRFWPKVQVGLSDECWPWVGSQLADGRGQIRLRQGRATAPRVAYELVNGPFDQALLVCHHCDSPACCNPAHLFLGTQKDNMDDMAHKGRQGLRGKISRDEAERLRESRRNGTRVVELQAEFGLSSSQVYRILAGERWA